MNGKDELPENAYAGYEVLYQEYSNNYLTIEKFAEHYNFTVADANDYINIGRIVNNMREKK